MASAFSSFYFSSLAPVPPEPFGAAFIEALEHGVMAAQFLPDSPEPVPDDVLARLHPEERAHAEGLRGYRQVEWVGGRLALRRVFNHMGLRADAMLARPGGGPIVPRSFTASISHKRTLAIAVAARAVHGSVGLDLEDLEPARTGIAERVLRPAELAAVQALPPERQWTATVIHFSLKEAIYKALHPHVERYVGFEEAEVRPDRDGTVEVDLHLKNGEGPFEVEARYYWLPGRVLSSVRIRPTRPAPRRS